MLIDVAKFCFIFFLVLSSFVIGLAQLYWYYDPDMMACVGDGDGDDSRQCVPNPSAFTRLRSHRSSSTRFDALAASPIRTPH